MDVARRLVQIPAEKIVYSAAARVSALVSEVRKEFEQDPASTTLVDNLEKMARDEQICNAFMHSDAFQSSMMLWEREFKLPSSSSSSVSVIENQSNNNNNNSTQQPLITSPNQFTYPTFSDFSSYTSDYSSSETRVLSRTESSSYFTSSATSFDPQVFTYDEPRWTTIRAQRVPISDRIYNYMSKFWQIFFKDQPAQPVLVNQPTVDEIPKSASIDDLGVPGSPPQNTLLKETWLLISVAGVAILLIATNLRFDFTKFGLTAAQGQQTAVQLIKAYIRRVIDTLGK